MDVSIIIPTYNRLWSLPAAIQSCRNTKCSVEIIVVDDGSTDGTLNWLNSQQGIVILHQENFGKCWAVNRAFAIANGKYVRFLDSDDMLKAAAIDEQLGLAQATDCNIVVSGYDEIDEAGQIIGTRLWTTCDDFIAQQLGECDGSHYSAFLFKKSFLEDIPHRPDYAFRDDRMLILEAALKEPKIAIHSGAALQHRVHKNNRLQLSNGLKNAVQNFQHLNIYKYVLGILKTHGQLTERRIKASFNVLWPLCHWIAKHDLDEAIFMMQWMKEVHPDFQIPEKGGLGFLYKNVGFKNTEVLLGFRRKLLRN